MTGRVFVLILLNISDTFFIHCIVCFIIRNAVFVRPVSHLLFYFTEFQFLLFCFQRKTILSGIPSN